MDPATICKNLVLLEAVIADRLGAYLGDSAEHVRPLHGYGFDTRHFADLNQGAELSPAEHVLVLLALVPHLRPDFFGRLIGQHLPEGGELPAFGGVRAEHHRGVLPTGETAQFVLAGDDMSGRIQVQRLLAGEHWLARRHVLWLDSVHAG